MIDKKQIKMQYKNHKTEAGVFAVKNKVNQSIYIFISNNLKNMSRHLLELESNTHKKKLLQEEWNKYGKNAFEWEVLETINDKALESNKIDVLLKRLEEKWISDL